MLRHSSQNRNFPLSGVTVLDMTRLLPGPYATMLLADLGARVINVTMPRMIDPLLHWLHRGSSKTFIERSLYRGKEMAAINFKKPAGRDLVRELARGADVFIEGYRPGALEKAGLGFSDLRRINPKLIYCSISGYGQHGHRRRWASHDINYLALSGLLSLMDGHGRPPSPLPVQIGDIIGGSYLALASILAALYEKQKSGLGQYLDVNMLHGLMSSMVMPMAETIQGQSYGRGALALTGQDPMYRSYQTADGRYMAVGAVESSSSGRLLEFLDKRHLAPMLAHTKEWPKIGCELESVFRSKTLRQWQELLENQEVCVSPVLTLHEALESSQTAIARGLASKSNVWLDSPFSFSRSQTRRSKSIKFKYATDAVLSSLGYSKKRLEVLKKQKIIS